MCNHVVADYRVHAANHHGRIVLDESEEPSIRHVLDYIFSQPESNHAAEARKQGFRGHAYAAQYLTLANKYFGNQMLADARRCYLAALRYSPAEALSFRTLRLLLATFLSPEVYSAMKRTFAPAQRTAGR